MSNQITLQDCTLLITDGKHGDCKNQDSSGYYFISSKDVKDGVINYENARQITEIDFTDTHRRTRFAPNDILITNSGTIGRMAFARDIPETLRTTFQKSVAIVKPNSAVVFPKWLYYQLLFDMGRISDLASGTAQKNLLLKDLRAIKLSLPSLLTQQKIAAILSAYDDLIENNLKRIKLLEEMAQITYEEWFVRLRFPGYESTPIDSATGLPEEWKRVTLGEVVSNFDRMRVPLSSTQRLKLKGSYPYYGAASVLDYINDYIFDGKYLLMGEDGTVITPNGTPSIQFVNEKFWANNHTHILQGQKISTEFLYIYLSQYQISNHITGAAQPKINQQNMNRIPMLLASDHLMKKLDCILIPIFESVFNYKNQNQLLREARNILLPRLMTGKIDVESYNPADLLKEVA
ncbi:restriction endonuclease subunit S [Nitrosomonas sp.]|uniref:restriction endonuclease subunit S n=1 Tax=Nitrosomonas sp. TaxID=42353 RepID=UPI00262712EF|nr:restriction endonuclease subunit S [Nitrosomonas sp.]MCW5601374.1 restriction endonuclease subunit S [Nitrosomonas sp.]